MTAKTKQAPELPDFLTEGADGSLTIALRRGLTINGAKLQSITMREPCVSDQLAADVGTDAQREVSLISNLAGLMPADIHGLKMRDYSRVQVALGFFYG